MKRFPFATVLVVLLTAAWCVLFGRLALNALETANRNASSVDAKGYANDAVWKFRAAAFADPDAYCWSIAARKMLETGAWRVRTSDWDNEPHGREFHWAQLPAWCIALGARARMAATGEAVDAAVAAAGHALLPSLAFVCAVSLFLFLRCRFGIPTALFGWAVLLTSSGVFTSFSALKPDHHAFQLAFFLATWWPLLSAQLGWREAPSGAQPSPRQRRAFLAAGVAAGLELWIGGTVFLFALASYAVALAATFLAAGRRTELSWDGGAWKVFARAAAATGLACWLVEYAPGGSSWHLEVNHPLYALMLFALGEAVPAIGEWWLRRRTMRARDWAAVAAWTAVAVLPAVLILVLGGRVHAMRTEVMKFMHSYIAEFQPLSETGKNLGPVSFYFTYYHFGLPAVLVAAAYALFRRRQRAWSLALLASAAATAVFWWMMHLQLRWTNFAHAAAFASATLLFWEFRHLRRPRLGRTVLGGAFLALAAVNAQSLYLYWRQAAENGFAGEATAAVEQNIRVLLLKNALDAAPERQGAEEPTRLFLPISYGPAAAWHRTGTVLGALYWENVAGVDAQQRFEADGTEEGSVAEQIARERGIEYVCQLDGEIAEERYAALPEAVAKTLWARLAARKDVPAWLEEATDLEEAAEATVRIDLPALDEQRSRVRSGSRLFKPVIYRVRGADAPRE